MVRRPCRRGRRYGNALVVWGVHGAEPESGVVALSGEGVPAAFARDREVERLRVLMRGMN